MNICFFPPFFTFMNNAAMDIHIQILMWTIFWFLLGKYLVVEQPGQMVGFCLTFKKLPKQFS